MTEQSMTADELVDIPQGWKPNPGDMVIGRLLQVTQGWSDYTNDYYPIVVIQPDPVPGKAGKPPVEQDPISVHAFHQVLRDRLVEARPAIGDVIGIKLMDKVKSKDGKRDITRYVVKVKGKDNSAQIWDGMQPSRVPASRAQPAPVDDDIPF